MIKCVNCNETITLESQNYNITIPEEIVSRAYAEASWKSRYYTQDKFCSEKCFNLKVADDLISELSFAVVMPEQNFLQDIERNVGKAKIIIENLKSYKDSL